MSKLDALIESEGYSSVTELLEAVITGSVCPAICMNDGCSYTPHRSGNAEEDDEEGKNPV